MQLNLKGSGLKEKKQLLNKVRVKYFTRKNKPLSILILLTIFVLFAIAQPLIAFFVLVAYGLILVLAIKRRQTIENKGIDNRNIRGKNENK